MSSLRERFEARLELELKQDLDATELVHGNENVAVGYLPPDITGHCNISLIDEDHTLPSFFPNRRSTTGYTELLELRVAQLIEERDEYDKRRRSAITLANKYKGLYDDLLEKNNE